MNILEYLKNNNVLYILAIIALAVIIFSFSGGIVTSIFEAGKELGKAIGTAIWK